MNIALFDVFGTLLQIHVRESPYLPLLTSLNIAPSDYADIRTLLMTTHLPTLGAVADLMAMHYPDSPRPDATAMAQAAAALEAHRASCRVIDGVPEMLATLRERGWRLGLITNLSSQYTSLIREHGLLDMVDTAVFSCDVWMAKPERGIFEQALSRLGGRPEEAVMVGDSRRADVEGARAVGIRPYWIDAERGDIASAAEMARVLAASSRRE